MYQASYDQKSHCLMIKKNGENWFSIPVACAVNGQVYAPEFVDQKGNVLEFSNDHAGMTVILKEDCIEVSFALNCKEDTPIYEACYFKDQMGGMRIGHFNRLNCFLENHILGDPTLRFANTVGFKGDINEMLTLQKGNVSFWKKQLNNSLPDMQSLALRELSNADYADMVNLLEETYFQSPNFVVRLQAMRLLVLNHCNQAVPVLKAALNDSYELVRRFAGEYVEKNMNK